jgi:hypothetical protein
MTNNLQKIFYYFEMYPRDNLEDMGVDVRIISTWAYKSRKREHLLDSSESG